MMARSRPLRTLAFCTAVAIASPTLAQDGFIRQPSLQGSPSAKAEAPIKPESAPAAEAPASQPAAKAPVTTQTPSLSDLGGDFVRPPKARTVEQNPKLATLPPMVAPVGKQATSGNPTSASAAAGFPAPPAFMMPSIAEEAQRELHWLKKGEVMPQTPPPQPSVQSRANEVPMVAPMVAPTPLPQAPQSAQRDPQVPTGEAYPASGDRSLSYSPQMPVFGGSENHSMPNAVEVETKTVAKGEQRQQLARMISARIDATKTSQPVTRVQPLTAPPGWQSVRQRLQTHLRLCEQLLQRNAIYSGRQEAEEAMLYMTQVLDEVRNEYVSTPAWARAQQALKEAEDFKNVKQLTSDESLMQRLVESHQTPVLKTAIVSQLPPLAAAQHYREYAKQQMREASKAHSWASEVFYALGRTYQAEADNLANEALDEADSARWKAVVFYRAAVEARASNALAANQLGYLLLQLDQPRAAQQYIDLSLEYETTPSALRNSVEASRRLGDAEKQQQALSQLQALERNQPEIPVQNQIIVVDQQDFANWSPYAASTGGGR